ncbi:MAG: hypothetical protein B6D37_01395 [Sphingobacteriales bacterium UTBCD1]|jgi:hypothetical protein|nr:MAG: hypothetical protein B6D37_01395 [Sphingobacteriales bacterium UTBCD1]
MELDDFKNVVGKMSTPVFDKEKSKDDSLNSIIELFKTEQKKSRRKSIIWCVVLIALSVIYFSITTGRSGTSALGMTLIGSGFILGALYFWNSSKPLPDKFYLLPPVKFLETADRRLMYLPVGQLLKIIPILVILGIGGGMVFIDRLIKYAINKELLLLIWICFFVGLCIFGYFAGKKDWAKTYGDLHRRISKAKKDLYGS